jgi:hypothetical protein
MRVINRDAIRSIIVVVLCVAQVNVSFAGQPFSAGNGELNPKLVTQLYRDIFGFDPRVQQREQSFPNQNENNLLQSRATVQTDQSEQANSVETSSQPLHVCHEILNELNQIATNRAIQKQQDELAAQTHARNQEIRRAQHDLNHLMQLNRRDVPTHVSNARSKMVQLLQAIGNSNQELARQIYGFEIKDFIGSTLELIKNYGRGYALEDQVNHLIQRKADLAETSVQERNDEQVGVGIDNVDSSDFGNLNEMLDAEILAIREEQRLIVNGLPELEKKFAESVENYLLFVGTLKIVAATGVTDLTVGVDPVAFETDGEASLTGSAGQGAGASRAGGNRGFRAGVGSAIGPSRSRFDPTDGDNSADASGANGTSALDASLAQSVSILDLPVEELQKALAHVSNHEAIAGVFRVESRSQPLPENANPPGLVGRTMSVMGTAFNSVLDALRKNRSTEDRPGNSRENFRNGNNVGGRTTGGGFGTMGMPTDSTVGLAKAMQNSRTIAAKLLNENVDLNQLGLPIEEMGVQGTYTSLKIQDVLSLLAGTHRLALKHLEIKIEQEKQLRRKVLASRAFVVWDSFVALAADVAKLKVIAESRIGQYFYLNKITVYGFRALWAAYRLVPAVGAGPMRDHLIQDMYLHLVHKIINTPSFNKAKLIELNRLCARQMDCRYILEVFARTKSLVLEFREMKGALALDAEGLLDFQRLLQGMRDAEELAMVLGPLDETPNPTKEYRNLLVLKNIGMKLTGVLVVSLALAFPEVWGGDVAYDAVKGAGRSTVETVEQSVPGQAVRRGIDEFLGVAYPDEWQSTKAASPEFREYMQGTAKPDAPAAKPAGSEAAAGSSPGAAGPPSGRDLGVGRPKGGLGADRGAVPPVVRTTPPPRAGRQVGEEDGVQ